MVPSNSTKTVYLMPKLVDTKDWSDGGNLEFQLDCEWVQYRMGNYGGVTNTPMMEIHNFTQHANYAAGASIYRAGVSQGMMYPGFEGMDGNFLLIYRQQDIRGR